MPQIKIASTRYSHDLMAYLTILRLLLLLQSQILDLLTCKRYTKLSLARIPQTTQLTGLLLLKNLLMDSISIILVLD